MAVGDVLQILGSGLAGFAAAPAPSGSPTYMSVTLQVPKGTPGAATNFDFDIGTPFPDHALDIEIRALGTTKGGTAHVTGAVSMPAQVACESRNGALQAMSNPAGGFKAQWQYATDMAPVSQAGNDAAFNSGGGSPMSMSWGFVGGATPEIFRVICTNQNGTNDADVTVFLTIRTKAAP